MPYVLWAKQNLESLQAEIEQEFGVKTGKGGLTPKDFWWAAHCHLASEDFPPALGRNMWIIVEGLKADPTLADERLRDGLALMLLILDVCPDDVLRDETMPLELKEEYIRTEMRTSRRNGAARAQEYCRPLTARQKQVVMRWLECLEKHGQADAQLVESWRAFERGFLPEIS